jgi:acetyl esterase/lipase
MRLAAAALFAGLAAAQRVEPPFSLPDGVEMAAGIVYASPGGRDLQLDLFLPKSGDRPFPAVVYLHGGGWSGGNRNQFHRQAAHMATRGVTGACVQYRLSGEAKYPAAIEDARAAVRWLRENAMKYRIDVERIGAAGGSAGGHLAALLGTTEPRVRAVAAFNPVLDLPALAPAAGSANNAIAAFVGATYLENAKLWTDASPITHASRRSAPILILHGTADATVPYQQAVDMLKKLKDAGATAELFTAEGAPHGFFNRPPWYEKTLAAMEEFFERTLK